MITKGKTLKSAGLNERCDILFPLSGLDDASYSKTIFGKHQIQSNKRSDNRKCYSRNHMLVVIKAQSEKYWEESCSETETKSVAESCLIKEIILTYESLYKI